MWAEMEMGFIYSGANHKMNLPGSRVPAIIPLYSHQLFTVADEIISFYA